MNAFKIKVLKSKLDSYWYSNKINKEYLARLDDNLKDFVVIPEGIFHNHNVGEFGDKCVMSEDCGIISDSQFLINTYTSAIKIER